MRVKFDSWVGGPVWIVPDKVSAMLAYSVNLELTYAPHREHYTIIRDLALAGF
ncbi:hypothetical protein [Rubinisphaera brasiliensis]|uniref:Uncharacterized protein n=1 Tax=Rubinisphaera brasiliensis (strain ATCC 49424 / DSM 5305 / JCM 21570 / IAM 15109 / NBRC 103401 / IFAM 1448) TaxID=756272 RepID=F0SNI3_RUBBR|nr:hypothetical protein [Rubinisphaera brasiliensis]ADY57817.1 hypothetical protein Plabr_0187 [Rubinisphaera brasiliensis DSM 5305]